MFNIYFNLLTYSSMFYICLTDVKKLPEDDLGKNETCRIFDGFCVGDSPVCRFGRNVQTCIPDGHLQRVTYVVWQKCNKTDFLLTMNFILFTNQGYPLQNSSLGQLHSDGGVVSIVRSSAGRLQLIHLSARRLRSSGYYPQ